MPQPHLRPPTAGPPGQPSFTASHAPVPPLDSCGGIKGVCTPPLSPLSVRSGSPAGRTTKLNDSCSQECRTLTPHPDGHCTTECPCQPPNSTPPTFAALPAPPAVPELRRVRPHSVPCPCSLWWWWRLSERDHPPAHSDCSPVGTPVQMPPLQIRFHTHQPFS